MLWDNLYVREEHRIGATMSNVFVLQQDNTQQEDYSNKRHNNVVVGFRKKTHILDDVTNYIRRSLDLNDCNYCNQCLTHSKTNPFTCPAYSKCSQFKDFLVLEDL